MKNIFKLFLNMVYPMLISLFLFIFSSAFVTGESLEPLQLTTCLFAIFFGVLFLIGFIGSVVTLIAEVNKK